MMSMAMWVSGDDYRYGSGIRTRDALAGVPDYQSGALSHSAIPPYRTFRYGDGTVGLRHSASQAQLVRDEVRCRVVRG